MGKPGSLYSRASLVTTFANENYYQSHAELTKFSLVQAEMSYGSQCRVAREAAVVWHLGEPDTAVKTGWVHRKRVAHVLHHNSHYTLM